MGRRFLVAAILAGLIAAATPAPTSAETSRQSPRAQALAVRDPKPPEGCQAFNPGQETSTFTATADAETPVSGAMGPGTWIVTVKRAGEKKPIVLKPDAGGGVVEFVFEQGDKVTCKALAAGTFMTAGFVQP